MPYLLYYTDLLYNERIIFLYLFIQKNETNNSLNLILKCVGNYKRHVLG